MNHLLDDLRVRFRIREGYLYCRITYKKRRCKNDFTTHIKVDPTKWVSKDQYIIGNDPDTQAKNLRLYSIKDAIIDLKKDLIKKGKPVTSETLKRLFIGKEKLSYTFIEVSQKHIEYISKLPSDEITKGTIKSYRSRHKNIVEFLAAKKLTHITCEEFSPLVAREFIQYLRVEREKPMTQNTAVKNIQLVTKVLKFSINQEWSQFNPLQAFVIKKAKQQMPPYLSEEERNVLAMKIFSIDRLQKIKDCFVFCCHTGLSFADVQKFRASQHLIEANGFRWIEMSRLKTGISFFVPLSGVAMQILKRYGGEQLPIPSNVKFNAYLKEVQEICGIATTLTVRTARTTFGVVMLNDMNVPLETVSKMLGHTSTKITEKHYAQVLKRKIVRDLVVNNPLLYQAL